jgi:hypothetical protein
LVSHRAGRITIAATVSNNTNTATHTTQPFHLGPIVKVGYSKGCKLFQKTFTALHLCRVPLRQKSKQKDYIRDAAS